MKFHSNGDFAVHVKDIRKAKAFYEGVLGFKRLRWKEPHLAYKTGTFILYVNKDSRNIPFIPALEVADYEQAKEYLKKKGCKIVRQWPRYKALYFKDPFGHHIDIIESARARRIGCGILRR